MTPSSFLERIRDLIAGDELDEALQLLRHFLDNTRKLDEILHQAGRFADIRRQIRLGTVSHEDATLTKNQIRAALLELLSEIETQGATPDLKEEVEKAVSIVESRNVVVGSTISGQEVHIGDKNTTIIYQNAPTPPASGRIFNKILIPGLVKAMADLGNDAARQILQTGGWTDDDDRFRRVQNFVCRSFVGEIGKQLRRLINIGDDREMDPEQRERHYADKCLDIARRSLDLVNFTLLSVWRETARQGSPVLQPSQRQAVSAFFGNRFEPGLPERFQLLQALCEVFGQNSLPWPFPELPALKTQWQDDSACRQLEADVKAKNCEGAEQNLSDILSRLVFLTRYRMASVKKVHYRQIRSGQPEFLHCYVPIGIDVKYSEEKEMGKWTANGEQNPSVLIYSGDDYHEGINLFPFVIDYNALTFEQGAKICFFSAQDLSEDALLEYRFLGDNSTIPVRKQGVYKPGSVNLDELMLQPENLRDFNLDCVVDSFLEARQTILGGQDDIFENL